MAKKKAAAKRGRPTVAQFKTRKAKKGAKKQSRRQAESVLRRGPIRRQPVDTSLPGLEQVRHGQLDTAAAGIADCRDQVANLKGEEAGFKAVALRYMHDRDLAAYSYRGITLLRAPGEEELIVKKSRQSEAQHDADEDGDVMAEDAVDEVVDDDDPTDFDPAEA
jgi:hypothetical protein